MEWIKKNDRGQTFVRRAVDDTYYNLNPQTVSEIREARTNNNTPNTVPGNNFKLLTVRRLTDYTEEQVNTLLQETRKKVEDAQIKAGFPAFFPVYPDTPVQQYYGIFIDEDLYPESLPVYVYKSFDDVLKAYVVATGVEKDQYEMHICHTVSFESLPDNGRKVNWRLFSLDGANNEFSILDSSALPQCYSQNYSPDNIHYLGGGTWAGIAIADEDKIHVVGQIDRFAPETYRRYNGKPTSAIVAHSTTPSYSFTWRKGNLDLTYRNRNAEEIFDVDKLQNEGVISINKNSNYSLDLTYRNSDDFIYSKQEYANSNAILVGNTNLPVNSVFQSPDYGTDKGRFSLQSYTQKTNIVRNRKTLKQYNSDRSIFSDVCYIPITTSDVDHSIFMTLDLGEGIGDIQHPYDLKSTTGERKWSHFYSYQYWWTYGQIVQFEAVGDTNLYTRNRVTDELTVTGSFYDKGELIAGPSPNNIRTTWNAPEAPTGIFSVQEGSFNFTLNYLNPPLIGHQGPYYYHLNPGGSNSAVPAEDKTFPFVDYSAGYSGLGGSFAGPSSDPRDAANNMLFTYTQMLGGTAGVAVPSLNIGSVVIADKDTLSLATRSPTQDQRQDMSDVPMLFPNGFWDKYETVVYNPDNHGVRYIYDYSGNITESYEF